mmetsp:Transcript_33446/g.57305  ORF Transcript_33446/g.57305 Transcript_33446/m.57305 type:complete len:325 (-) Transcript_33446:44-1018(-)
MRSCSLGGNQAQRLQIGAALRLCRLWRQLGGSCTHSKTEAHGPGHHGAVPIETSTSSRGTKCSRGWFVTVNAETWLLLRHPSAAGIHGIHGTESVGITVLRVLILSLASSLMALVVPGDRRGWFGTVCAHGRTSKGVRTVNIFPGLLDDRCQHLVTVLLAFVVLVGVDAIDHILRCGASFEVWMVFLEVHEALLHLAIVCALRRRQNSGLFSTEVFVSVLFKLEQAEVTDSTNTLHIFCVLPDKCQHGVGTGWQREAKHRWRQHDTQQLHQEQLCFVLEHLAHFVFHFFAAREAFPFDGKVMRVSTDLLQQERRRHLCLGFVRN